MTGGIIRMLQSFMGGGGRERGGRGVGPWGGWGGRGGGGWGGGGRERGNQVNFIVTQAKCPYDCLCRRRLKRSFNDRYPTV